MFCSCGPWVSFLGGRGDETGSLLRKKHNALCRCNFGHLTLLLSLLRTIRVPYFPATLGLWLVSLMAGVGTGLLFLGGSEEDGLALAQQAFSEKDHIVNILGFAGRVVSAVILVHCSIYSVFQ